MLTGIILIAIIGFIGVISYKRPRLEQRVFKKIPLVDWFNILIFPLFMYLGLVLIVRNILLRDYLLVLDLDDVTLLSVGVLALVYVFVGNSIHFVSKVLSRYIPENKHSLVYQVNEIFHQKLSHYLAFLSALMALFILALLEFNHPLVSPLPRNILILVLFSGFLFGISGAKSILYASGPFGWYIRPLFYLAIVLFFTLLSLYKLFQLSLSYYPVNLFISSFFVSDIATFVVRRFLIFTRLGRKRKLKFLAKLLSA